MGKQRRQRQQAKVKAHGASPPKNAPHSLPDDSEPGLFDEPAPKRSMYDYTIPGITKDMDRLSLELILAEMADTSIMSEDGVENWFINHDLGLAAVYINDDGSCTIVSQMKLAVKAVANDIVQECQEAIEEGRNIAKEVMAHVRGFQEAVIESLDELPPGSTIGDAGNEIDDLILDLIVEQTIFEPEPCASTALLTALKKESPTCAAWMASLYGAYHQGFSEAIGLVPHAPPYWSETQAIHTLAPGSYFWLAGTDECPIPTTYIRLNMTHPDGLLLAVDTKAWNVVMIEPNTPIMTELSLANAMQAIKPPEERAVE